MPQLVRGSGSSPSLRHRKPLNWLDANKSDGFSFKLLSSATTIYSIAASGQSSSAIL
jgi:hypothetical protein